MIECGQNSKPKKLPGPKINPQKSHAQFPSHNKFGRTLFAKLVDPQKNPGIENFNLKIVLRSSPSLEIRSDPPGHSFPGLRSMPF